MVIRVVKTRRSSSILELLSYITTCDLLRLLSDRVGHIQRRIFVKGKTVGCGLITIWLWVAGFSHKCTCCGCVRHKHKVMKGNGDMHIFFSHIKEQNGGCKMVVDFLKENENIVQSTQPTLNVLGWLL